ncbi:hypothetical protein DRV85_14545 [Rhodosalinus halophilus]|uniref:3-hydroxyacyl-CoA dehydrogenase n=1 Tax=Rhodosalinus halophilus TaxID=2259333 RepID=A0A365U617_9RHOB|nr:3-hydroxyacyl-CoA dehydrogenase family protein [Rhodosalinus halophilus]RBI83865.1 hypothetical protein DRV85_14545 [Rhodosalinus halophilus]
MTQTTAEPFGAPPPTAERRAAAAAHLRRAVEAAAARSAEATRGAAPPERPAVLGSGPAAVALAGALAAAGFAVTLHEPDPHDAARARDMLGRFLADEPGARWRVEGADDALARADMALVPEAGAERVVEQIAAVMQRLPEGATIAVALGGAGLARLAEALGEPPALVGLTLQPPAHATRLAEVATHPATAQEARASAYALAGALGRITLETRGAPLAESLLLSLHDMADRLLIEGAEPWTLDAAMTGFGYATGPLEAQDLAGLPALAAARAQRADGPPELPIRPRMLAEGRLGKAAGVGWYRYPGGGGAVIDPLIEDLIHEEAHFAGVAEVHSGAGDLREALLLAQIAEAVHLLGSGAAGDAAALDLASVHGAGFPEARGGVLRYAAEVGAARLGQALDRLQGRLLPDRAATLRRALSSGTADPARGKVVFRADEPRVMRH